MIDIKWNASVPPRIFEVTPTDFFNLDANNSSLYVSNEYSDISCVCFGFVALRPIRPFRGLIVMFPIIWPFRIGSVGLDFILFFKNISFFLDYIYLQNRMGR